MHLRRTLFCALTSLCLAAGLSAAGQVQARAVTDHLNRTVEVPDEVKRVAVADIFPYPSMICVYLGTCKPIVAMHPTSMAAAKSGLLGELFPEALSINTRVMQGADVNLEALMALGPDVVFVNAGNKRLIARLESAGLPVLAVSTGKWNYDVIKTYENWIALLKDVFPGSGNSDAALKAAHDVEKLVAERTAAIPQDKRRRVLFLVQYDGKRIVTSGSRFFGQYWAQAAGAVNVGETIALEKGSAVIDIERVLQWNPDAVFLTNFTRATPSDIYNGTYHNWAGVKAFERKAVYKMPLGLYRSYTPSADSPMTLLWLAKTLYPESFADIDLAGRVVDFYHDVYGLVITRGKAAALFPVEVK